ncbi:33922_t:CDS:1, partial [Racocetra persica]
NTWQQEYNPIPRIQAPWYKDLDSTITIEELHIAIKEAPSNKATGPQNISNKMLKHLDATALSLLFNIFNACLNLQQIP